MLILDNVRTKTKTKQKKIMPQGISCFSFIANNIAYDKF